MKVLHNTESHGMFGPPVRPRRAGSASVCARQHREDRTLRGPRDLNIAEPDGAKISASVDVRCGAGRVGMELAQSQRAQEQAQAARAYFAEKRAKSSSEDEARAGANLSQCDRWVSVLLSEA
jgi:hypothetical protein